MSFDPNQGRTTNTRWTIEEYVDRIDEFHRWAVSIGVTKPLQGRYAEYKKILDQYAKAIAAIPNAEWGQINYSRIINAKLEVHKADRIRRAFEGSRVIGIQDKLKHVFSGPEHYRDEKRNVASTQSARNTLLELSIGAVMLTEGNPVQFGDSQFPEPLVYFSGTGYAFQCKRISSFKKKTTEKRIREAVYQVRKNTVDHPDLCEKGVIVLDISKLINPRGQVLICQNPSDFEHSDARHDMLSFYKSYLEGFPFAKYSYISCVIITASFISKKDLADARDDFNSYKIFINNPIDTTIEDHTGSKSARTPV